MYTQREEWNVERLCYDDDHVQKVMSEISKNFDSYFQRFLETEAGASITAENYQKLQARFGVNNVTRTTSNVSANAFQRIMKVAITEFEKDRQDYLAIFDTDALEEYEDDAATFKSIVLKNKCPIIRKTYANKTAKELDKYRRDFNIADADELLAVVTNLSSFANEYVETMGKKECDLIGSHSELQLSKLDTNDEYTAFGVIGGGIKSMMLYKFNPELFPSRSRFALWALWYLSSKKTFGCETDSEFLMIDVKKSTTQQNYFYPYELFSYYALEVYRLLQAKANEMGTQIDRYYRYVIVDAFFDYVAKEHIGEINMLTTQIRDDRGYSYA